MRARIPLLVRNIVIAVGVGALIAPLAATSASADDDVVIIPSKIPYIVKDPIQPELNFIQVNASGYLTISQSSVAVTEIKPQCVLTEPGSTTTLCVGQQSAIDPNQARSTSAG